MGIWQSENWIGKNSPHWEEKTFTKRCIMCNKEFQAHKRYTEKGQDKFCSHKCHGIWRSKNWTGENNPCWRRIKRVCEVCGKEFLIKPYRIKKGEGKFCSSHCFGIWNCKHSKKKNTLIEIMMEQELIKNKIPYMKQVPVEGIALVDFLLPNKIIIQCDGDYWHSKEKNKGKDIAQDTVLTFRGYKVFRFWEHDIKKSTEKCIKRIFK